MKIKLMSGELHWEVYLFFALYVVAPTYCAIEVSTALPLLTVSRMLLVLLGVLLILRRRKNLNLGALNFALSSDMWLRCGLLVYFVFLTICNLVLLPTDVARSLKAFFALWVEGYALVWFLSLILDTRKK